MARVDRAELARKQRERKQKILLVFMLLLLVILLVWQGPKTLKHLKGGTSAAPARTSTQPSATSGTPSASSGASASGGSPATTDPQAALVAEKKALGDTDPPPVADQDQLISFSRFSARDPFVQLVGATTTTATTPSQTSTPPTSTTPSNSGGTSYPPPSASTPTGQVALSINGTTETHVVGDTFPANDPAFKIASVNGDTVQIGLASGQFSGGQQTIGIKIGEEVTLVSQPDGARYTIKVISIS